MWEVKADEVPTAPVVLLSVFRTLKQRGHDPIEIVIKAIETYMLTDQIPPLPTKNASDG